MRPNEKLGFENVRFTLPTEPYPEGNRSEAPDNFTQRLGEALLKADERIAALESELKDLDSELKQKEAAIDRMLLDDVRMCEELTELQETLWYHHRGLPSCECNICNEVQRYRREVEGVV